MGKLVSLTQLKFQMYWMHTTLIQFSVSSPLISSTKNANCDRREIKIIKNLSVNWLLQIDVTLYTWFTFHYCSDLFEMHAGHCGKFLPNCWSWSTYCPFSILKSDAHLHDPKMASYCLTENAACAHYEEQVINPVYGNNLCLLWESFDTRKYTVQQNAVSHCFHRFCMWLPLGSK